MTPFSHWPSGKWEFYAVYSQYESVLFSCCNPMGCIGKNVFGKTGFGFRLQVPGHKLNDTSFPFLTETPLDVYMLRLYDFFGQ